MVLFDYFMWWISSQKHIYNKDYRNHQYLHKRLQYLTAVAGHLKEVAADIKLTYRAGNPFHPILVVNVPGRVFLSESSMWTLQSY